MAVILSNEKIAEGVYKLVLEGAPNGRPGQFFMLHISGFFLGRPISICDQHDGKTVLCYAVIGQGTKRLCELMPGQTIEVNGPYGNGFELCEGEAVLIGGGLGTAPLFYLCRALKAADPARKVSVYLGFKTEDIAILTEEYKTLGADVTVNIGGFVTEDVDFSKSAVYYTCGPKPMMAAAAKLCKEQPMYVSLESKMACGTGACLGCTIETASGNRRVCKDGPVFPATEVFYEQ